MSQRCPGKVDEAILMSIDTMVINLDKRERLCPLDMELRSEIRHIENVPGLFHVALVRLLLDRWKGDRVSVIIDCAPDWPEDEQLWASVLPEVVESLLDRQAWHEVHGASRESLLGVLANRAASIPSEIAEAEEDGDRATADVLHHELNRIEGVIARHQPAEPEVPER